MNTKSTGIIIGIILLAITVSMVFSGGKQTLGSAQDGVQAVAYSTATTTVASTTATTLFASSTTCTARIITTNTNAVVLSFNPDFTPTLTAGHYQAASTTVAYDSGIYGCGVTKAISATPGVVTISETR